jgi:putative exosortase-associated protein (TIGR04073 family)
MRQPIRIAKTAFAAAILVAAVGCAKTEAKMGRGLRNMTEVVRLGEMQRSIEQTALFEGPDMAYTTGFIRGLNKTLARTGVGIYEVVTAPFPPYDPVWTNYLTPSPQGPDSGRKQMLADPMVGPDTYLGFSGGDVAPMVPGNRFRIFDF